MSLNRGRIAVIGAGPAGSGFATALLAFARRIGSDFSVTIFDHSRDSLVSPPLLIDREGRRYLSSLGVSIFSYPGLLEIEEIYLWAQGTSERLPLLSENMWVLDQVPSGYSGSTLIKQALVSCAQAEGATVQPWRVESIEPLDKQYVVRARGRSDTYQLVVGAFGCSSTIANSWLGGHYLPPPLVEGMHARIHWSTPDQTLRLFFRPSPETDLLVFVPTAQGEAYAFGTGNNLSPQKFAQVLGVLMRDRALPGKLEIAQMERLPWSNGVSNTPARRNQIGVGSTVLGELLTPGLSWALGNAIRSAQAVAQAPAEGRLKGYSKKKNSDLRQRARQQAKILWWSCRAGPQASSSIAYHVRLAQPQSAFQLPVSGIHDLSTKSLLRSLRFDALQQVWGRLNLHSSWTHSTTNLAPDPKLVFIVDDDADVRAILQEFLEQHDIRTKAFDNELTLLDAAARESPGTILLDIVLPWINGLSLCYNLRHHPATAKTRLISMSSLGRPSDRRASMQAGADAFLPKPIDLPQLLGLVTTS